MFATLKIRVLAGVLAAVYGAAVLIVWIVQTRAAADRLDGLMEPSVACAVDTVDWAIEPEVLHVARVLVDRWKSADAAARADLRSVQTALDCDQINIVGTNDVIIASTDPAGVGLDMMVSPETDEFTALNRGENAYKTQRFRRSRVGRPGGAEERGSNTPGCRSPAAAMSRSGTRTATSARGTSACLRSCSSG